MERLKVVMTITNESNTGGIFGVINGSGESCYIPIRLLESITTIRGDVLNALVVDNPNVGAAGRTPYLVVYAERLSSGERALRLRDSKISENAMSSVTEAEVWQFMYFNRESTYHEVAAATGTTEDQVRTLIYRTE